MYQNFAKSLIVLSILTAVMSFVECAEASEKRERVEEPEPMQIEQGPSNITIVDEALMEEAEETTVDTTMKRAKVVNIPNLAAAQDLEFETDMQQANGDKALIYAAAHKYIGRVLAKQSHEVNWKNACRCFSRLDKDWETNGNSFSGNLRKIAQHYIKNLVLGVSTEESDLIAAKLLAHGAKLGGSACHVDLADLLLCNRVKGVSPEESKKQATQLFSQAFDNGYQYPQIGNDGFEIYPHFRCGFKIAEEVIDEVKTRNGNDLRLYLQTGQEDLKPRVVKILSFNPQARIKPAGKLTAFQKKADQSFQDCMTRLNTALDNQDQGLCRLLKGPIKPALNMMLRFVEDLPERFNVMRTRPILIDSYNEAPYPLASNVSDCLFRTLLERRNLLTIGEANVAELRPIKPLLTAAVSEIEPSDENKLKYRKAARRLVYASQGIKEENPQGLDLPFAMEPTYTSAVQFVHFMQESLKLAEDTCAVMYFDNPCTQVFRSMQTAYEELGKELKLVHEPFCSAVKHYLPSRNAAACADEKLSFLRHNAAARDEDEDL
jgi:hypothetical protein